MALSKLRYFYSKKKQINCLSYAKVIEAKYLAAEERNYTFKAQIVALAYLFYFKKIYKKSLFKRVLFY